MNKRTLIFPGLFSALTLVIGIFIWWFTRPVSGTFEAGNLVGPDREAVTAIELTSGKGTFRLELKDSVWRMVSPVTDRADRDKIETIFRVLGEARLLAPVSRNQAKFHLFGIDSLAATLRLVTDEQTVSLKLGKTGPDYASTFVLNEGGNEVWSVAGLLSNLVGSVSDYRDKALFRLQVNTLSAVRVESTTENLTFNRDSTGWFLAGKQVKEDAFLPFSQNLSRLDGFSIIDSVTTIPADWPLSAKVTASGAQGQVTVSFYKIPNQLTYAARVEGSEKILAVNDYLVDRFLKPSAFWTEP